MADPTELELKLDATPRDIGLLKAVVLPRLTASRPSAHHLVSVYFDTPRMALRKQGYSLRLRFDGERRVQTIKASRGAGVGLFDRSEWETAVQGEGIDLEAVRDTPLHALLLHERHPLGPVFETVIDRTVWRLSQGSSMVEVAVDEGRVVAGDRTCPISEVELELKHGSPSDLFALLHGLGEARALRLGVVAKSERGYALLDGKTPACFKAEPVALTSGMTVGQAFQAIVRACIRQFRLNEPFISAEAPEFLHQARVAMRRLRSALSLFEAVVADPQVERLKERLRAVSRDLGDARDLDVYLADVVRPEAEHTPAEPGVAAFGERVERQRTEAYARLATTLSAPAFRILMLDLLEWVEAGLWLVSDDPFKRLRREQPVRIFAADVLDRRRRQVKRKGRRLDTLDPDARHRVRIAAKKLRYAAEFFAALVRKKDQRRHDRFIDAMQDLQAVLGELNDIKTGHALVADIGQPVDAAAPPDAAAAEAAEQVTAERDARTARLLDEALAAHRAFRDARRFWSTWT